MNTVASKDGTRIAYDRSGSGPAVIMVGGAMSFRAFPGFGLMHDLLAANFTAINYDRRGRGDSGDTKPYAVEREVEDIAALIDAAGGSACLWGYSSGAALAVHAAAAGLDIVKLALYEPPYMVGTAGQRPPKDHREQLQRLVDAGRRSDAVKFFLAEMVGIPSIFVTLMKVMPMWSKLKAVAHTLPYDAAVMGDFTLPTAMLSSIDLPTLVVGGEKSQEALRNAVREVAATIPGARLRMLPRQTHNVSMKVLAPVLTEFFLS
ncbi:MAG: alpha/beta hydrolase [Bacteroidetes bacterium]|nr:alpha/beta hydrolase [Bacteroidota bacterium]